MTRLHPDLDNDDLQDLSRRLHDLADRWEVAPPAERPDLTAGRRSRWPDWLPSWLGTGMAPALAGLAIVVVAIAASVWLSTLSAAPDVVERDGAGAETSDLLDEVPVEAVGDGPFVLTLGDVQAATNLIDGDRPDLSSPPDEVLDWLSAISGVDPAAGPDAVGSDVAYVQLPSPNSTWLEVQGWDDQLGWSLLDVDRFIDVDGSLGLPTDGNATLADGLTVITGPAAQVPYPDDVADVGDDAVRAGSTDCSLADSAPPVRLQGCPLYLARGDDRLLLASQPEQVDSWKDGDVPTLADDADLVTSLGAIGSDWTTAQLVRGDFGLGEFSDPDLADEDVLPAPFDVAALSWARDADGPVVTVAYLHDDAEAADRNAGALGEVWAGDAAMGGSLAERVTVEDVRADDRLAIVTLRPSSDMANAAAFTELSMAGAPFQHAAGVGTADGSAAADIGGPGRIEGWTNDLPFADDEVLLSATVEDPPGSSGPVAEGDRLGGWLPVSVGPGPLDVTVHASCRGSGSATIGFDDPTVEPSEAFPCDGSTMSIDRTLPDGDVEVGFLADEAGTVADTAWLAWAMDADEDARRQG